MTRTSLWIRAEIRAIEQRAPLVPADVARLVGDGVDVVIERCAHRVFGDAEYLAAGARLVEPGSWVDAPAATFVIGLKELPAAPSALRHRHVYFGHAYKGQPNAAALLERFTTGGGELFDLEYLTDEWGRRLAAFGYWAGYVGAALAVLRHTGRLTPPLRTMSRETLDGHLAAACVDGAAGRALVLGALGRCGAGARAVLEQAGMPTTCWDIEETRDLDRAALLDHDIVVNTVLTTVPVDPFLTLDDLASPDRRLTLLADVTCDVGSDHNLFPLYDDTTSWDEPVRRLPDTRPPLDVIVIDNLPSLLPREASVSFSAALWPHIPALGDPAGVWRTSRAAFRRASTTDLDEEHNDV